ncbi:hypothetical protein ACLKA7_007392 [Drosophila subpalustris]
MLKTTNILSFVFEENIDEDDETTKILKVKFQIYKLKQQQHLCNKLPPLAYIHPITTAGSSDDPAEEDNSKKQRSIKTSRSFSIKSLEGGTGPPQYSPFSDVVTNSGLLMSAFFGEVRFSEKRVFLRRSLIPETAYNDELSLCLRCAVCGVQPALCSLRGVVCEIHPARCSLLGAACSVQWTWCSLRVVGNVVQFARSSLLGAVDVVQFAVAGSSVQQLGLLAIVGYHCSD